MEKGNKDLAPLNKNFMQICKFSMRFRNSNTITVVYFYYSQARWRGALHHVTNKLEWTLRDGAGPAACEHEPLEEQDKPWLTTDSKPHERLRDIVLDKRLLNNLKYYVNFR